MPLDRSVMHLDPRAPLVVDTRALGRSPGAMRRESRTVPAPASLGLDMIGVPEGADVELDIRLEAVMEGVLVSGLARAPLTGECARCLEPFVDSIEVEFQELYAYPDQEPEEDAYLMEGDLLDLEPAFRDALVLALPVHPLCREDCPGLCSECGARLADVGPDHSHPTADPRWAALRGLLDSRTDNDESEET
ncbi:MAG: DUF177 domain-containing protein [Streptosporangiales bacterium]|nr:DUF177 domain-containing protein [Streptosporangiales bacterium]